MVCVRIRGRLHSLSRSVSSVVLPQPATAKITRLARLKNRQVLRQALILLNEAFYPSLHFGQGGDVQGSLGSGSRDGHQSRRADEPRRHLIIPDPVRDPFGDIQHICVSEQREK